MGIPTGIRICLLLERYDPIQIELSEQQKAKKLF